jgi:hypothetical protein
LKAVLKESGEEKKRSIEGRGTRGVVGRKKERTE